jgi:hypothetical protein
MLRFLILTFLFFHPNFIKQQFLNASSLIYTIDTHNNYTNLTALYEREARNEDDMVFFDPGELPSQVENFIRFRPGDFPFYKMGQVLLQQTIGVEWTRNVPGNRLSNYGKCGDLFLDPSQKYHIVRTKQKNFATIFDMLDIKLPFSTFLAKGMSFVGKNYCIAFNLKNYGLGFDPLAHVPCLPNQKCGIQLLSTSLSVESKLVYNDDVGDQIAIYDGMRYHHIARSRQFLMNFRMDMPAPRYINNEAHYYPDLMGQSGFHFRLNAQMSALASFKALHLIYFKLGQNQIDLFYKKSNLLTFRNPVHTSGLLRDSASNALNTCFPSGLFFKASVKLKKWKETGIVLASKLLSGLIGLNLLQFKVNVDAGVYFNLRKMEQNGLFLRGILRAHLFCIFKLDIDLEIQKVNNNEIKRRIMSMKDDSLCADYEMTEVTSYIFQKFGNNGKTDLKIPFKSSKNNLRDYRSRDWKAMKPKREARFINLGPQDGYVFVGFLKTRAKLGLPLVKDILGVNGNLDGIFVTPSPYIPGHKYHMEFYCEADLWHIVGFGLEWDINDERTVWKFFGLFLLFEIDVYLEGPSDWLTSENGKYI